LRVAAALPLPRCPALAACPTITGGTFLALRGCDRGCAPAQPVATMVVTGLVLSRRAFFFVL
jgi:hypothetical protein